MIEYLNSFPDHARQGLYNQLAPKVDSVQLNTISLERNSTLVVRVSKDSGYDLDELRVLKQDLENIFPNHPIFIWYDDIEFITIHDKGYKPERLDNLNDATNYY